MRTYLECIPCFFRQALDASRRVTDDDRVHETVLRRTLRLTTEMPFNRPPPWMGQQIHRMLREAVGEEDPYFAAKREANEAALALLPKLRVVIDSAPDPFEAAVRVAAAGNVMDLGVKSSLPPAEIETSLEQAVTCGLDRVMLEDLRDRVKSARSILYLADNAGEIVLDRLLIERFPAGRVTVAVRGGPVINDATLADARAAGLAALAEIIDNGSDAPGTILDDCSPDFLERFHQSEIVIAKGQGNYETLSDVARDVFFLLKVKCPVIARDLACAVGGLMLCRSGNAAPGHQDEAMAYHA